MLSHGRASYFSDGVPTSINLQQKQKRSQAYPRIKLNWSSKQSSHSSHGLIKCMIYEYERDDCDDRPRTGGTHEYTCTETERKKRKKKIRVSCRKRKQVTLLLCYVQQHSQATTATVSVYSTPKIITLLTRREARWENLGGALSHEPPEVLRSIHTRHGPGMASCYRAVEGHTKRPHVARKRVLPKT